MRPDFIKVDLSIEELPSRDKNRQEMISNIILPEKQQPCGLPKGFSLGKKWDTVISLGVDYLLAITLACRASPRSRFRINF